MLCMLFFSAVKDTLFSGECVSFLSYIGLLLIKEVQNFSSVVQRESLFVWVGWRKGFIKFPAFIAEQL